MSDNTSTVLVAIDLSDASDDIIDVAERVARTMAGKLFVLHVAEAEPDFVGFDAGPEVVRDQLAHEYREEHAAVQEHSERLRNAGVDATALLVKGPVVDTVLGQATGLAADLLIVGSHGKGAVYDLLVGSVSQGILRKSHIPVMVVPHRRGDG